MGVTFIKYAEDGTLQTKTVNSEYSAKVYPLVCDRLTLTCDLPVKVQHIVKNNFKQDKAKHDKGYQFSIWIEGLLMTPPPYSLTEDGKLTSAYIQCAPYNPDTSFLRIDFNPAKVNVADLKQVVNINLLNHPDYDFDYVLKNGKVTRCDLAVDISHEQVGSLYYHYPKIQYVEVHSKSGRTEYLGGKTKTGKRIAIYDRLPVIKANNAKKYYDPKQQIPLPDNDIMRVEVRLFPKEALVSLLSINNPFSPLVVSTASKKYEDDPVWDLFLALARFEGAQATLGRLTKHKRKEYVDRLKKAKAAWWRPEEIWAQFPYVIQTIKNA